MLDGEAGRAKRAPQSEVVLVGASVPEFVPILAVTEAAAANPAAAMASAAAVEIELAGAVVHIRAGTDTALVAAMLRAVRASATLA